MNQECRVVPFDARARRVLEALGFKRGGDIVPGKVMVGQRVDTFLDDGWIVVRYEDFDALEQLLREEQIWIGRPHRDCGLVNKPEFKPK